MVASSRTRYTQIANGTLQDDGDLANEEWAAAFPVPFRAGMYPFPKRRSRWAPPPASLL